MRTQCTDRVHAIKARSHCTNRTQLSSHGFASNYRISHFPNMWDGIRNINFSAILLNYYTVSDVELFTFIEILSLRLWFWIIFRLSIMHAVAFRDIAISLYIEHLMKNYERVFKTSERRPINKKWCFTASRTANRKDLFHRYLSSLLLPYYTVFFVYTCTMPRCYCVLCFVFFLILFLSYDAC